MLDVAPRSLDAPEPNLVPGGTSRAARRTISILPQIKDRNATTTAQARAAKVARPHMQSTPTVPVPMVRSGTQSEPAEGKQRPLHVADSVRGETARRAAVDPEMKRPAPGSRRAALAHEAAADVESASEARQGLASKMLMEMRSGIIRALLDPCTTDVERNTDGRTFVVNSRLGNYELVGNEAIDDWGALNLIGTIAALVDEARRDVTRDNPHLETPIPHIYENMPGAGCRFTATIPPQAARPMFAFRKPGALVRTLTDYLDDGLITMNGIKFIRDAISERKNIGIVGPTGSGKTSFANSVLGEMSSIAGIDEKFAIIEDAPELICTAPRYYNHFTIPYLNIGLKECVKAALRYTPTRICIGELRVEGAYELFDAWQTGHKGGLVTFHAGNAIEALDRMQNMATINGNIPKLKDICHGLEVIIVITKTTNTKLKTTKREIGIFETLPPESEFAVRQIV